MTGIIVLNKPSGITSFGAVARVRRLTGEKRCGHGGTLDPEASGLLPVLVGKATRLSDRFLTFPKKYRAELTLGLKSDTGDIWGNVERTDAGKAPERVTREAFEAVLPEFTGTVMQLPPAYSALKIGGVAAYKLARRGETPELKPRPVNIYSIEPGFFRNAQTAYGELPHGEITVCCGRGTYIRTLCEDIGARLGTGAVMSKLTRLSYGRYSLEDAVSLDELEAACAGDSETICRRLSAAGILKPCDEILEALPAIRLDGETVKKYLNGAATDAERFLNGAGETRDGSTDCRVYSPSGVLLGVGSVAGGSLRPRVNLSEQF